MFLFHPELIEFFAIKQKAGKRINVKKNEYSCVNPILSVIYFRMITT